MTSGPHGRPSLRYMRASERLYTRISAVEHTEWHQTANGIAYRVVKVVNFSGHRDRRWSCLGGRAVLARGHDTIIQLRSRWRY